MKEYIKPIVFTGKTAARHLAIAIEIETYFERRLKHIKTAAILLHNFLLYL